MDGIVCEIDFPPDLEKNKKHSIDVVIDRLKIKPGIEQRLAESFETAIQLADGLAMVSVGEKSEKGDGDDEENLVFSSLFACPNVVTVFQSLSPACFPSITRRGLLRL